MKKLFLTFLTMPRAAILILAVCIFALGFVLIIQFGFGFQPCILCLWQRVPFVCAGLLAFIAFLWKPNGKQSAALMALCSILFLLNAGLAFFHSGVERHWWLGTSGCSIQPLHSNSVDHMRDELLNMGVAHCDVISWSLFGLSMANYNIPFCLALAVFCFVVCWQIRKL
jgi:disulfide bond formation protein DsbB